MYKQHCQAHYNDKIRELHKFLTRTFEQLVAVVENGTPDFHSGHDYVKLAEAVAVRVCRLGCTVAINEPTTPIEAMRLVGKLLGWTQDIIDRERPRK
jgi:hypothetical protein